VAAGKTRNPKQIQAAISGGVGIIGHNYIQEAQASTQALDQQNVSWHFIGHLQRNKAKTAVELFDMVETLDSLRLAKALEKACAAAGKKLAILLEVNSGEEANKTGVMPDDVYALAKNVASYQYLKLQGLMTMGPWLEPEEMRPYFQRTKKLFEELKSTGLPMQKLSMGMSKSFQVAIEEGANLVRIGTALFGPR
jgi:pyridoxal phosphate enzyme (YggS family)